jgi:type I restriction enzyme S subunit
MSQAVNEIKKLPQGWRRAPLRETADIVRGISFPKEARRLEPQEGSVACLRTANVQREVDWGDLWFVPEEYVKLESRYVRLFDVLISVSNSLELVGKVAQVTSLPHKSTLGAFISLLRPSTEVDAKLYYYQLTWFAASARGSSSSPCGGSPVA